MFGGPFNRLPFNRQLLLEIFFSVDFESNTEFESRMNLEMPMSANFEMETEFSSKMTREIHFGVMFESATELITKMVRERMMQVEFESKTEFDAKLKLYHVDEIEFVGEFKPGDKIIIDSEKFKITRNGENVSHLYEGDFFDLNLGTNNLAWTDPETGRNILFRITHRDKFLY
ncbi:phage distal tail protein [Paenibacillus macerans]|uniref:phage distal tail protein n=1 Tax=Paenibacillus macerans TaxID=44252 RepID=UPI003D315AD0